MKKVVLTYEERIAKLLTFCIQYIGAGELTEDDLATWVRHQSWIQKPNEERNDAESETAGTGSAVGCTSQEAQCPTGTGSKVERGDAESVQEEQYTYVCANHGMPDCAICIVLALQRSR